MRDNVRDEERRRRDEAKINTLQQQLDEMRSMVREVVARQSRNEEGFKQYELALSQLRTSTEQHRHEVSQSLQARGLEDSRVRQQLTELDSKIEETSRPIRSLQAHIAEIIETLRRGRDETRRRAASLRRTEVDHRAHRRRRRAQHRRHPGHP